ncbi:MAG: hypothetical protein SW833_06545 [Cyanobacteriota bacterium]|nr:hypothetical protein [Cyanobacteriota bacterium]
MTTEVLDSIPTQLMQILIQLPLPQQRQVLEFAKLLYQQTPHQKWDTVSDEEAAALKAEFGREDIAFAEAVATDYLSLLQYEDEA